MRNCTYDLLWLLDNRRNHLDFALVFVEILAITVNIGVFLYVGMTGNFGLLGEWEWLLLLLIYLLHAEMYDTQWESFEHLNAILERDFSHVKLDVVHVHLDY